MSGMLASGKKLVKKGTKAVGTLGGSLTSAISTPFERSMGSSGKGRVSGSHGFMHEDSIGSAFDDPNFFMDDDDEAHFDENHDHDGEEKGLTNIEEEVLITSLLNSEEIAPVVGAVYERGLQKSFAHALARYAQEREQEIVGMCHEDSALNFIQSVDAIAHVREETEEVGTRLAELNRELQEEGREVLGAEQAVTQLQRSHKNIQQASQVVAECKEVLLLCSAVKKSTEERRYQSALHGIEQLRQLNLRATLSPSFGRYMELAIPVQVEMVKEKSVGEFNEWLSALRTAAPKVGEVALQQAQESAVHNTQYLPAPLAVTRRASSMLNSQDSFSAFPAGSLAKPQHGQLQVAELEQLGVDLGPLFRCLHVHRQLGEVSFLRAHYRQCRRAQAQMDHAPPPKLALNINQLLKPYLARVLGYFLLEQAVSAASQGVLPRAQTDNEWASASLLIANEVAAACDQLSETAAFLQLRTLVHLTCFSLDLHLFSTRPLREAIDATRERYVLLLQEECRKQARRAVREDNFDPVAVLSPEDWRHLVSDHELESYRLSPTVAAQFSASSAPKGTPPKAPADVGGQKDSGGGGKLELPAVMSFSRAVPRLMQVSKSFAFDVANFVDPFAAGAVEDVTAALERFLKNVINHELVAPSEEAQKQGRDVSIHQALNLFLNASVLEEQCLVLVRYAQHLCTPHDLPSSSTSASSASTPSGPGAKGGGGGGAPAVPKRSAVPSQPGSKDGAAPKTTVYNRRGKGEARPAGSAAAEAFGRTRTAAEDLLFSICLRRAEQMLARGDSEFEWSPTKPVSQPSDYILDLASFLRTVFPTFSILPASVMEALHYTTCKTIAAHLAQLPLNPKVRKINHHAFVRADADLSVLESFAQDSKVPGLKETFIPLRQLITLMTGPSLAPILDEVERFQCFGSVDLKQLLVVLEKYREGSGSLGLRLHWGDSSARKKEVDAVVKKIRELLRE